MDPYFAEFFGTMLLILIGDGVCANASLAKTKGNSGANWVQINTGFALAVFVGVLVAQDSSGAHINPAVTLSLAVTGDFPWSEVGPYMFAQLMGAFVGAILVFLFYIQHFRVTDNADTKLGCFCTAPAIRGLGHNLFSEAMGTFVLVFAVLMASGSSLTMDGTEHVIGLGAVGAIPVALIVFAIGIGLGGTSGYGINPARDLGPRIAHAVLPIPNKRDSDWSYSWVPIVGPFLGGLAAAGLYLATASS